MELIGSIANNLTSAVQSARRLRGQAVHADTLAHGRSSPPCPPSAGRGLKRTYLTSHSGTRARAGRSYPLMAAFDPLQTFGVAVVVWVSATRRSTEDTHFSLRYLERNLVVRLQESSA